MFLVGSLLSSLTLSCGSAGHNPWTVVSKGNCQGYLSHSLPFAWFHHKCSEHFARKPSAGLSSKGLVIQQSVHDTELNHGRDASLSQQHGRQLTTTTLSEREICGCRGAQVSSRGNELTFTHYRRLARNPSEDTLSEIWRKKRGPQSQTEAKDIQKYGSHCIQVSPSFRDPGNWGLSSTREWAVFFLHPQ